MGTRCGAAMHCGVWNIVREKPINLAEDIKFVHFHGGWERLENH